MEHAFNTEHAEMFGDREAIMIKNFAFWIGINKANKRNLHDGRTWTYNSVKAMEMIFSYWSPSTIKTVLKSLIKQQILVSGNYNDNTYDRTKWYAFLDEKTFLQKSLMHLSNTANGIAKTSQSSYTDTNTDSKQIKGKENIVLHDTEFRVEHNGDIRINTEPLKAKTKEISKKKKVAVKKKNDIQDSIVLFETFWQAYSYKVNKKATLKIWQKLKPEQQNKAIAGAKKYNTFLAAANKHGYKMYPTTYLNGERWEDELLIPKMEQAIKLKVSKSNVPEWING